MKVQTFVSALLFAAAGVTVQAQTPTPTPTPAKAAPKPAAAPAKAAPTGGDKTLSLGGKSSGGPILTRDELRVCFSQEESIRKRLEAHTALRTPLDKEKADLSTAQAGLRTERAPLEDMKKQAEDLSQRMKNYGDRVTGWNERVKTFNSENPTGAKGERERVALNKERDDLAVVQKSLEAEKTEFAAKSEATVREYNAKAAAVDAQVSNWNQRNEQWNQDARALEADRSEWVINCADRRYREDDEIAIKRSK